MMKRAFFAVCALALADLAGAAEYEISFSQPSQVAAVKLEPGRYRIELRGSVVVLTDPATGKSYTAVSKVEKTSKKSSFGAVVGNVVDGVQRVDSIVLAGADFKLNFAT